MSELEQIIIQTLKSIEEDYLQRDENAARLWDGLQMRLTALERQIVFLTEQLDSLQELLKIAAENSS